MGIERGGNSEYEEYKPSFDQKTAKWEETLQSLLAEDPSLLKLSGKYITNDDVTIICDYHGIEKVRILDLADNQISDDALPVLLELENLAQKIINAEPAIGEKCLAQVNTLSVNIIAADPHNQRKKDILFTSLEEKGITGPPAFGTLNHAADEI